MANTKKFTEKTGIEVRVDNEGWEDVRPKAAVAANVGSGPDIIVGWFDDAHQYPDKLVDVTDVANYLGDKYGGWYPVCAEATARARASGSRCRWASSAALIVYRESHVKAAGFDGIPEGHRRLPQALPGAEGQGHARRLRARQRHRRRQQLGALAALVARRQAGRREGQRRHRTARRRSPRSSTRSSSTRRSCRARCRGSTRTTTRRSSTGRSRSPRTASRSTTRRRTRPDPKLQEMAADISTRNFPIGPVGGRRSCICSSRR